MEIFSENLRSSPSAVSMSLLSIKSYLLLVELYTWHFHYTILVALNSGGQKYMFTFFEVVNLPAWVSHVVISDLFCLTCDSSLPYFYVELIPLYNIIQKSLNFAFPLRVFIELYRIVE